MRPRSLLVFLVLTAFAPTITAAAQSGIITKPSGHSVAITLDRLEVSLKERGFMIFTRIDHAAAAASVGLKMPASTVLIFGNPRLGTPSFLKQPTLAIDLPLKALVYQDASGKVFISYNSSAYIVETLYSRHGLTASSDIEARIAQVLAEAIDAAAN